MDQHTLEKLVLGNNVDTELDQEENYMVFRVLAILITKAISSIIKENPKNKKWIWATNRHGGWLYGLCGICKKEGIDCKCSADLVGNFTIEFNISNHNNNQILIPYLDHHPDLEQWMFEEIKNYFNLRNFTCVIKRTKQNLYITITYDGS